MSDVIIEDKVIVALRTMSNYFTTAKLELTSSAENRRTGNDPDLAGFRQPTYYTEADLLQYTDAVADLQELKDRYASATAARKQAAVEAVAKLEELFDGADRPKFYKDLSQLAARHH